MRLHINLWEVELAQVPRGFLGSSLVWLLCQSQKTVEASIVFLDVLCFELFSECGLTLAQSLLNKCEIVLRDQVGAHFDVMLDLSHHVLVGAGVGGKRTQCREGLGTHLERLLPGQVHQGIEDVAKVLAELVLQVALRCVFCALLCLRLSEDQVVCDEE